MNTRLDGCWPAVHELTLFQLAELAFVGWYTAMSYRFIGPRNTTVISSSNGARFPALHAQRQRFYPFPYAWNNVGQK